MRPFPKSRTHGIRKRARILLPPARRARVRFFVSTAALLLLVFTASGTAQGPLPPLPEPPTSPPLPPSTTIREEDLLKAPRRGPEAPLHTIVIDPGHGGRDAGVRSAGGLLEKDVVLSVARKLSVLIQRRMGIRVILTRTGDHTLPLLERTAIANHAKGQILISLHTEGAFRRQAEGIRVSILGPSSPPKPGPPSAGENRGLQAILWDIAQTGFLNESSRFARLVADALTQETGLRAAPIREAPLLVLRGALMPAVVVSVGHLTNPQEESLLGRDEFQEKIAQGLFEAVRNFIQGKDVPQ
ncbi:MAG: N-acetylmuramoyl-L-alanine amidase [Nitrospinota bacterium]